MRVTNNQVKNIRAGRYTISVFTSSGTAAVEINPAVLGWIPVPDASFTASDSSLYSLPAGQVRVAIAGASTVVDIEPFTEYNETSKPTDI